MNYVLTHLYYHVVYKKKQQLLLTPLKNSLEWFFLEKGHPVIYVSRKLTPAEQYYVNIEREALAIVFRVKTLKQFLLGRQLTLQTDHKPLKYLFAPDEEIPKTASTRITRRAIALMGFEYKLNYTPGEQIPHADAVSRMGFNEDESDNDRDCFTINNVYFAQ